MDFLGSLLSQLSLTLKKILFDTKKKHFDGTEVWEINSYGKLI